MDQVPALLDGLGRPLKDLRISVTDRCNFRCVYCMPKAVFGSSFAFLPRQELLSFEEIARLARIFAHLGVTKIRLTGGEPLIRKDLPKLVHALRTIPQIQDLAMTTNGSLLNRERAHLLKDAGLDRVTVSLDALDDETFSRMNDVNFPVRRVLEAIAFAQEAGLTPIKINMVVKRGLNEHSIVPMAAYFREHGQILRFIEFMDVGTANGWRLQDVVPESEILSQIASQWPLEPVAPERPGEVARRYRYRDGKGEIGLISSVTQPFCQGCSRARLSPEGQLFLCLFGHQGYDLRAPLRSGASDHDIMETIQSIWRVRNDRYSEQRSSHTASLPKVEMFHIGG